jgi:hypothetical protein
MICTNMTAPLKAEGRTLLDDVAGRPLDRLGAHTTLCHKPSMN